MYPSAKFRQRKASVDNICTNVKHNCLVVRRRGIKEVAMYGEMLLRIDAFDVRFG